MSNRSRMLEGTYQSHATHLKPPADIDDRNRTMLYSGQLALDIPERIQAACRAVVASCPTVVDNCVHAFHGVVRRTCEK